MQYYKLFVDGTNSLFTYVDKEEKFNIGDRVVVDFKNRERGAFIIQKEQEKEFKFRILEIKRKLENELSFSKSYIELLIWISNYYMCNFSQVISAAIPKELKIHYNEFYCHSLDEFDNLDFSSEEKNILEYFFRKETVNKATIRKKISLEKLEKYLKDKILIETDDKRIVFNFKKYFLLKKEESLKSIYEYFFYKRKILKKTLEEKFDKKYIDKLLNKKVLFLEKNIYEKDMEIDEELNKKNSDNISLNKEQKQIVTNIENSINKYFLIRGVTGSGKTEIYIRLIKDALMKKKGSIFLVPEISLTPQMKDRFRKEFGDEVAVLHSNISDSEKRKEWIYIEKGYKKIVLGARSAIFAPIKNLEYIIIDEEHESTYKQDTNPRYNAKYVAIKKAMLENAKVIFGSATPDIESYFLGKTGKFQLEILNKRFNNSKLPDIELVDMKKEENTFFSKKLLNNIKETLLKKEQIIILLNRKGYSTMVQCKDCGHIEECKHCSIKLSYYESSKKLKCNYCGKEIRFAGKCSKCGSQNLYYGGKGTEQIEEKLKEYFNVPIIRVDSETTKEKNFYEKVYFDFLNKKYDIMIGTQMIAKGLHFPNVTLVGVINADLILDFPDFRASEKTFQLITQVAGRAGRDEKEGKVIIQTYQPENYIMENIKNNDYENFYNKEIEIRNILAYPPFSKTINIGFSSTDEKRLDEIVNSFYKLIKRDYVEIFSPNKSLVYKVKDRYRKNIFIKGERVKINYFKKEISKVLETFDKKGCRIIIDIDPINLI